MQGVPPAWSHDCKFPAHSACIHTGLGWRTKNADGSAGEFQFLSYAQVAEQVSEGAAQEGKFPWEFEMIDGMYAHHLATDGQRSRPLICEEGRKSSILPHTPPVGINNFYAHPLMPQVNQIASGMAAIGASPQKKIGIFGANSPSWMMTMQKTRIRYVHSHVFPGTSLQKNTQASML
eukprot:1160414-Pelagomonas_calceolata.AAC.7